MTGEHAVSPTGGRLSEQEVAAETRRLLESLPHALVAAMDPTGLIVPMPTRVPLNGQTVLRGHASVLELIEPDDLREAAASWRDTHVLGAARVQVRPAGGRESATLTVHLVDAQAEYGVLLCFLEGDLDVVHEREGDIGSMRPRVATVRKDERAVFTGIDEATVQILGHTDLVGRPSIDLIHPDDATRAVANWMDTISSPGRKRKIRLRLQHRDGHWIWFEMTNHNRLNDPAARCVVAEMVDISEEMAAHEFLRAQEHLLRRLTDSLPVGVAQIDHDGLIVHRNPQLTVIVGQPDAVDVTQLFTSVVEEDKGVLADAADDAARGQDRNVEVSLVHEDGQVRRCQVMVRPLDDQGAIICVDDITERARLRDQLHIRATYDELTGCLNRASVLQEIARALADADGPTDGVAVVFVDLDGFKEVNDRCGHAAGDELLRDIAACLQHAVRNHDLVGRIGGDEFLTLSPGVATAEQALAMADRLADALAAQFGGTATRAAVASLGVAWVPGGCPDVDADQLIGAADVAMYESKAAGLGRPVLSRLSDAEEQLAS